MGGGCDEGEWNAGLGDVLDLMTSIGFIRVSAVGILNIVLVSIARYININSRSLCRRMSECSLGALLRFLINFILHSGCGGGGVLLHALKLRYITIDIKVFIENKAQQCLSFRDTMRGN